MFARNLLFSTFILLAGCAMAPRPAGPLSAGAPVSVHIIAFNDFHGALQPPRQTVPAPGPNGTTLRVPAGGAAYLASAIDSLRAAHPDNVVVAAGDLISASPLVSALFLDEPSIEAMNMVHLEYSALGNHEFDKGRAELIRDQKGGCEVHTARKPCAIEPFPGAKYQYLAANTLTEDGLPLFPAYGLKSFGSGPRRVTIGFIGLTLKGIPTMVTPAGITGLRFTDEADAANALVPILRRKGADAIVILIHQGGTTTGTYNECPGLDGDILPILDRLDPAIDLVVSGHTHRAYVCDYQPASGNRPILLTSAGNNGTLLTDITLAIDPDTHRVVGRGANNIIVQGEPFVGASGPVPLVDQVPHFPPDPAMAAHVDRYVAAVTPLAARPAGIVTGPAGRVETVSHETVLGELVADAQLAATSAPDKGGAQVAFMNVHGVRADLVPAADGSVTYGQLFATQPFGNTLVVKTMTGRQIVDLLEQQFESATHTPAAPGVLQPSSTLRYAFDLSRPRGSRVSEVRIGGAPIDPARAYRVTMNNFLASGGDDFTMFREGTDALPGPSDVDALETYIRAAGRLTPPVTDRIRNLTPGAVAPNAQP